MILIESNSKFRGPKWEILKFKGVCKIVKKFKGIKVKFLLKTLYLSFFASYSYLIYRVSIYLRIQTNTVSSFGLIQCVGSMY